MGRLSTHVLDLSRGRPAAGVVVEVWRLDGDEPRALLKTVLTNEDGRTDAPLLDGDELLPGVYELVFLIGDYFATQDQGVPLVKPPFLDRVPVRFGVADAAARYHVPLLASPWAYSTYRGS